MYSKINYYNHCNLYVCATSGVQDGRDLLHASAISGNEELVHMLVDDYALVPSVSAVITDFCIAVVYPTLVYIPHV